MPHVHSVHVTLLTVGVCEDEQRAQFFSMVSWLFYGERKDDIQQTEMNNCMSERITASVTENINKCTL